MNVVWIALAIIFVFIVVRSASKPSRTVKDIRLEYSVTYARSGEIVTKKCWTSTKASQGRVVIVGSGWTGIRCTVSGAAVPIEVANGVLFVLLPRNGFTIGSRMCDVMTKLFSLPYGDDEAAWVSEWEALKGSSRSVSLPIEYYPKVLFIPHGAGLAGARELEATNLGEFGVSISDIKFAASPDVDTSIPKEIRREVDRLKLSDEQKKKGHYSMREILVVDAIS